MKPPGRACGDAIHRASSASEPKPHIRHDAMTKTNHIPPNKFPTLSSSFFDT